MTNTAFSSPEDALSWLARYSPPEIVRMFRRLGLKAARMHHLECALARWFRSQGFEMWVGTDSCARRPAAGEPEEWTRLPWNVARFVAGFDGGAYRDLIDSEFEKRLFVSDPMHALKVYMAETSFVQESVPPLHENAESDDGDLVA
ncbi:MAG: hypothetical protein ACREA0_24535 [bacterium]